MSNPFVDVTITRANRVPTQAGFGTPLIWTNDVNFSGVKSFGDPSEMLDDVFSTTHAAYKMAVAMFQQEVAPEEIKVAYRPGATDPATELAAVIAVDNDWYVLVTDLTIGENLADEDVDIQDDIMALAAYIESLKNTNPKIFFFLTRDADTLDAASTVDALALLTELNYDRTIGCYTRAGAARAANQNHAAWVGGQIPKDPGSITWKFKNLVGQVSDDFTATELDVLDDKHANIFRTVGGLGVTSEGYAVSGEFIDIVHGQDFVTARITENVFGALASAPKIPYTDPGVDVLKAQVQAALTLGVNVGLYTNDPAPTVTAPLVSEVSTTDKANRNYPGIKFTATYAGAIHHVGINGVVSV